MTKNRVNKGNNPYLGNAVTSEIPVFSLYGETARVDDGEFVHIEDIRARSSLYDWHIKPHQHRGLFQILFVARGAVEVQADGQSAHRCRAVRAQCAAGGSTWLPVQAPHPRLHPHHFGGDAGAHA